VLQTLIRCRFSPLHSTGQRFIYSGCASGSIVSKCNKIDPYPSLLNNTFSNLVYDSLTGEMVQENRGHCACVRDVSWHPFEPEMVSSSWDSGVVRWSPCEPHLKGERRHRQQKEGDDDDDEDDNDEEGASSRKRARGRSQRVLRNVV